MTRAGSLATRILAALDGRATQAEIAARVKSKPGYVQQVVRAAGRLDELGKVARPRGKAQAVLALCDGTLTGRQIAAQAGCNYDYALHVVRQAGLGHLVRHEPAPPRPKSRRHAVIAALDPLKSSEEIAAMLGVDGSYVRQVARSVSRDVIWARRLGLSRQVAAWLAQQAQNGVEPEDVIRAALVDAWADSTEGAGK